MLLLDATPVERAAVYSGAGIEESGVVHPLAATLYALTYQADDVLARKTGGTHHGFLHGVGRLILIIVVVLIVIGVLVGVVVSRLFRRR